MRRAMIFVSMLALANSAGAECSTSLFSINGLYYSPTGDAEDAFDRGRLSLPQISRIDGEKLTALSGTLPVQDYSPDGRFYLRSGVDGEDYIVVAPAAGQEAVIVRRVTQANNDEVAQYVSLSRQDLDFDKCTTGRAQGGLSGERYFYKNAEFYAANLSRENLSHVPLLDENFHFEFTNAEELCRHTLDIRDDKGNPSPPVLAYMGRDDLEVGTRGEQVIDRVTGDLATLLLPAPAYASLPSGDDINRRAEVQRAVNSTEASLFAIEDRENICLDFPAPIATGRLRTGIFFVGNASQRNAALRLARSGDWLPDVTEIHFQQVEISNQKAFVRLRWKD